MRRKSRDRDDPGVRKRTRMSRRREAESGNGAESDGAHRKSGQGRSNEPRKGGLRNQTEGLIPRDGCASAVRRWWRRRCGQESVEYAWKEDSRVSEGRQAGAENIGQGAERGRERMRRALPSDGGMGGNQARTAAPVGPVQQGVRRGWRCASAREPEPGRCGRVRAKSHGVVLAHGAAC